MENNECLKPEVRVLSGDTVGYFYPYHLIRERQLQIEMDGMKHEREKSYIKKSNYSGEHVAHTNKEE